MPAQYEQGGRTRQKHRTRDALIAAARDLVSHGETPTVDDAANAAGISRTTAYRYFPTRQALLAAAHPETETRSLLPPRPPADPAKRLELVLEELHRVVLRTEAQQRTMLRLSLEATQARRAELPLRQGRAIGWIEDALSPLLTRMSKARVHRLALAIRSATGIEALVWLIDVAGLSRKQATETARWSAQAMLQAALAEGRDTRRSSTA